MDATVANLVEGVVPFTPEPVVTRFETAAPSSPQPGPSTLRPLGDNSSPVQQVSASSFGKSVHERGLSLQERKQRLLLQAQLRYCERHGLQIPGINCWNKRMAETIKYYVVRFDQENFEDKEKKIGDDDEIFLT